MGITAGTPNKITVEFKRRIKIWQLQTQYIHSPDKYFGQIFISGRVKTFFWSVNPLQFTVLIYIC